MEVPFQFGHEGRRQGHLTRKLILSQYWYKGSRMTENATIIALFGVIRGESGTERLHQRFLADVVERHGLLVHTHLQPCSPGSSLRLIISSQSAICIRVCPVWQHFFKVCPAETIGLWCADDGKQEFLVRQISNDIVCVILRNLDQLVCRRPEASTEFVLVDRIMGAIFYKPIFSSIVNWKLEDCVKKPAGYWEIPIEFTIAIGNLQDIDMERRTAIR